MLEGLAGLGDEPRILDRDHRLRGEVLYEGDLLIGERPHLLTVNIECAEQRVVLP